MNKCEYYNLPLLIVPNYCRLFCGGGFLKILFLGKEEKQSVKHFLSSILNKGTLQEKTLSEGNYILRFRVACLGGNQILRSLLDQLYSPVQSLLNYG